MKWGLGLIYFGLALLPLLLVPLWLRVGLLLALLFYSAWNFRAMESTAGREQDLRPLTRWDCPADPTFLQRLDDAAATMGLRSPTWAVEEEDEAFRYTVAGPRGLVVFSRGLLRNMAPDELLALAGHELQHIRSRDTLPALLGTSWLALLGQISATFRRAGQAGALTVGEYGVRGGGQLWTTIATILAAIIDLVLAVVGWVAASFLASRAQYEEHLADLAGARLTSASVMARALIRLETLAVPRPISAPRWSPEWVAWRMNASPPATASRVAFLERAAEGGEIDG